jgi:4-hydroxybenzoate polyprenyltransferase
MPSWPKLASYAELIRLNRPIGIYLLLWPTLWALFIAGEGRPTLTVVVIFVLGVILMRSAGCAINDYADRNIDGHVSRTKHRPVVSGRVSAREALSIFAILCLIALVLTVIFLNQLTLLLSMVAVILVAVYPFTKRMHYMPQVHLGIAFAWAVPMAFAAQTGLMPPAHGWLIFTATVIWTTAYDTIYGMIDRDDDIKIGVKSTAILFGEADRLIIGILQILTILGLIAVGMQTDLTIWFYISLIIAAGLFIYQQKLIHTRESGQCLKAFLNNNIVGLVIFIGIVLSYWMPI